MGETHPDARSLCHRDHRSALSATLILLLIFSGLVGVTVYQWRINIELKTFELNYKGPYFGLITDVHLDMLQGMTSCRTAAGPVAHYSSKFGVTGCEASSALVNVTLSELARVGQEMATGHLEFVLNLGGTVGQWVGSERGVRGTITEFHNMFTGHLPGVPLYTTLGETELLPTAADHKKNKTEMKRWLGILWEEISPLLGGSEVETARAGAVFRQGGYYTYRHSDSLTILSLNTAQFLEGSEEGKVQLGWLEDVLRSRDQEHVIIIGHHPPGISLPLLPEWYETRRGTWRQESIVRYNAITSTYANKIKGTFFGHHHVDSWMVKEVANLSEVDGSGVEVGNASFTSYFILPPVAPVGSCEPSFTIAAADKHWNLVDLLFFYSPLDTLSRLSQTPLFSFFYSFKLVHFRHKDKDVQIEGSVMNLVAKRLLDPYDGFDTYRDLLKNTHQLRYTQGASAQEIFCVVTEDSTTGLETCLARFLYL